MERIDKRNSKSYPPLILYIEELKEIIGVFKESSECPKIKSGDYKYESMDELIANCKGQCINDLDNSIYNPLISLTLTNKYASLSCHSSKPAPMGLFHNIDKILTKAVIPFHAAFHHYTVFALMMPISAMMAYFFFTNIPLGIFIAAALIYYWYFSFRLDEKRHSRIWIKHRSETGGFLKRNKDQLIVALIAAVVGGAIGVVGTLLVSHLLSKN